MEQFGTKDATKDKVTSGLKIGVPLGPLNPVALEGSTKVETEQDKKSHKDIAQTTENSVTIAPFPGIGAGYSQSKQVDYRTGIETTTRKAEVSHGVAAAAIIGIEYNIAVGIKHTQTNDD